MNKKNITKWFSMLLLTAASATTAQAAVEWQLTDPGQLATGDVVVIVDTNTGTAMSHSSLNNSQAPSAVAVTLSDTGEQLYDLAEGLDWEVTVANGSYQFNVPETENYLYAISNNNGLRIGNGDANTFTIYDNEGVNFLYNEGQSRYIGVYNSQDWRCYTSIINNIAATRTAFFKKTEVRR